MKLVFLCGGLEPGKNGVGDYTRRLALECHRVGHQVALIALRDRDVKMPLVTEDVAEGVRLPALRLPLNISWEERIEAANRFLTPFEPDWVSLQFVPYAFHPKGIVTGLGRRLQPLFCGRKKHFMFHELWIGADEGAPLREKAVGTVQRLGIENLVHRLKPEVIHTSNEAYIARMAHRNIQARHLPLFGNIPVQNENADEWLFPALRTVGLELSAANRHEYWLFGLFGGLHSIWPTEPLFSILSKVAESKNKKIALLSIGNLGAGESLYDAAARRYGAEILFLKLGRQPAGKVSAYLNSLDAGIAASPWILIGKSGSALAMLEHGLPVIVNRDDVRYSGVTPAGNSRELLYRVDEELSVKLATGLPRNRVQSRLPQIAQQFLTDLQAVRSH